jgi:chemotaxis-related protein WspD
MKNAMADIPPAPFPAHTDTACWRRIGSRGGDRSCDALAVHERCEQCPVLRDAATAMLDRTPPDHDGQPTNAQSSSPPSPSGSPLIGGSSRGEPAASRPDATRSASLFVFRLGDAARAEWLALPAASVVRVEAPSAIHTLPHRNRAVVLGLVIVRGRLTVAASLPGLLGIPRPAQPADAGAHSADGPSRTRLLVCALGSETAAFPIDEADGLLAYDPSALRPVSATLARAAASHFTGLLAVRERTVGLLSAERLFESLRRHLR